MYVIIVVIVQCCREQLLIVSILQKGIGQMNTNRNKTVYTYIRLFFFGFLIINMISFVMIPSANAKKKKSEWVTTKGGNIYYYNKKGEKCTKKTARIKDRFYSFDKEGKQHVGWIKYKDHYSFYRIKPGKKGYMVTDKTINGIKINKKGWAVNNLDKAALLAKANTIVSTITNFNMSQAQKNRACFVYVKNNIKWLDLSDFRKEMKDWDRFYANYALFKGQGDCHTDGCGFAYMATAAGAKNVYAVSSGGHGWVEINGSFYDPNWSQHDNNVDKFYNVPKKLSGKDGRPSWASCRVYIKRID